MNEKVESVMATRLNLRFLTAHEIADLWSQKKLIPNRTKSNLR